MTNAVLERHKLVVRSVGSATPAVSVALAQALPIAPARLARCLYQAPAVLLDNLAEQEARTLGVMLERAGLVVDVRPAAEPLAEGGPECEIAVHVNDAARLRNVAVEVARFLGCTPARAIELLCASPPVVLGQVSRATAQALAERLARLPAEVDFSVVADARYDVFVDAGQPDLRRRLARQLQADGVPAEPEGPLLAVGIPRGAAESLWTRVGAGTHWRLLDQAMQRFDLMLDAAPDTPEATQALVAVTGMPPALVPKVCAAAPLVLLEGVRGPRGGELLEELAGAGVAASLRLVTLLRWDVVLRRADDPAAAAGVLASVLGREKRAMELALTRLPARIDAAASLVRARWLEHELAGVGADAVLEER